MRVRYGYVGWVRIFKTPAHFGADKALTPRVSYAATAPVPGTTENASTRHSTVFTPQQLYERLTDEEDARICKDIPDEACAEVPGNFLLILLSQFLTKLGDAIASPRPNDPDADRRC